jgi:alpha-D-ribose 1-methylphosphonate 5-triphosphate diphosphatase PhnM
VRAGGRKCRLVRIGALIERAEASRLSQQQRDVFKVICRVTARNVMMFGNDDAKISEVDLAAGNGAPAGAASRFWASRSRASSSHHPGRLRLTNAGWAFAWATGLIKPTWKVPT